MTQRLLEARLHEELKRGGKVGRISLNDVTRDWSLMERAMEADRQQLAGGQRQHQSEHASYSVTQHSGGNNP
jgi:hypothetical protein